jgi:hypothetical protein
MLFIYFLIRVKLLLNRVDKGKIDFLKYIDSVKNNSNIDNIGNNINDDYFTNDNEDDDDDKTKISISNDNSNLINKKDPINETTITTDKKLLIPLTLSNYLQVSNNDSLPDTLNNSNNKSISDKINSREAVNILQEYFIK